MREAKTRVGRGRLALEVALAVCALWLVAQNALLLTAGGWDGAPVALTLAGALVKAVGVVVARVWPLMLIGTLTLGIVLGFAARDLARGRDGR